MSEVTQSWTQLTTANDAERFNAPPAVVDFKPYFHPSLSDSEARNFRPFLMHHYSDIATLFTRECGDKYRYSPERGKWLVFHREDNDRLNIKASHYWTWDDSDVIHEDVKAFLHRLPVIFNPPFKPKEDSETTADKFAWLAHEHLMKSMQEFDEFQDKEEKVTKKVPKKGGAQGEKEEVTETKIIKGSEKIIARARKWRDGLDNTPQIRGLLSYLQSSPYFVVGLEDFDSNPEELNTPGGLYNLRTLEVRNVSPHNTVRRSTTVAPRFEGETPRYSALLSSAFQGDQEMMDYFECNMGGSLLGGQYIQQFFYLWGQGGSGKGTLMHVAEGILGIAQDVGYAVNIDSDMFVGKQDHPTQYMQFLGARVAITHELPKGKKLDEAKLKKLTGNDRITGRYMKQDFVTFNPTHNLWITANSQLRVDHDDTGMWRRIRTLHTPKGVPGGERISKLEDLIVSEEGPEILGRWMKAAQRYLEEGFFTPDKVLQELEEYRESQDSVKVWLETACTVYREGDDDYAPDRQHFVTGKGAREQYVRWCKQESLDPVGSKAFTLDMKKHLGEDCSGRGPGGSRGFFGVKIEGYVDLDL